MQACIAPGRPSERFARLFVWYTKRLASKRFEALRLEHDSHEVLMRAHGHDAPVVLAMNHASWWDPLIGLLISSRYFRGRYPCAPMAMQQWQTFGFMRRLGVFGIETEYPDAIRSLVSHVGTIFTDHPRALLAITPQGGFADVRSPVRIRPGISAIAASQPRARYVTLATEYAFWNEQRPEVFLRAREIDAPPMPTTAGWHRAITRAMRDNAGNLSRLVIARSPDAFMPLGGIDRSATHPVYDRIARIRGRSTRLPTGTGASMPAKPRGGES